MRTLLLLFVLAGLGLGLWLGRSAEIGTFEPVTLVLGDPPVPAEARMAPRRVQLEVVSERKLELESVDAQEAPSTLGALSSPDFDPLEAGDCGLTISIYDIESGAPGSGELDLWRIDAPDNPDWNRGDRLQARLVVDHGVVSAGGLPAGRYRIHTLFAKRGADSPPAFQVDGRQTTVSFGVPIPKEEHVYLHLVRSSGVEITDVGEVQLEVKDRGWRGESRRVELPIWRQVRSSKGDHRGMIGFSSSGSARMTSGGSWKEVVLSSRGVDLGEIMGDSRALSRTHRKDFRTLGGQHVTVLLELTGAGEYVAVLPDPVSVHSQLEFPFDGRKLDVLDDLWIESRAVPILSELGESLSSEWGKSEVRFRLSVSEYKNVDVRWRHDKRVMPGIRLISRPPLKK
jgi:hypothetical protein